MQHLLHSRTGVWRRNDLNETMIIMVTVDLLSDVSPCANRWKFFNDVVEGTFKSQDHNYLLDSTSVYLLFPLTELSVVLLHQ